ncbi:Nucleoside-diphosphate sugar epimerase [Planctomycetales bacterium 10988]|nr:Nucleoside-diphosphate sugar epimerase [Planctomycetales bacterium 10988]
MKTQQFTFRSELPVSVEEAFAWHARPGAFERLTPPWEPVHVKHRQNGIKDGAQVELETKIGPLSTSWKVEHLDYIENEQFRDVQLTGPFQYWDHLHRFEAIDNGHSRLEDRLEFILPGGSLGKMLGKKFIKEKLKQVFQYRHAVTASDLKAKAHYQTEHQYIAVSGSHGLVGSQLLALLRTQGHTVRRIVRKNPTPENGDILWQPNEDKFHTCTIENLDAVVHLAGESIMGRWTEEKKKKIRQSRVQGTKILCEGLAEMENPPKVLVCASAMGYYGDRGDEVLTEASSKGENFLAEVAQEWEEATAPAREAGIRVVNARFGIVLSAAGGALAQMLPIFQLGGGGRVGSGKQWMSWITLDDLILGIYHSLLTEELSGPVNLVSPEPVTNQVFTETLAKVVNRPHWLPAPAAALKLAMGQMADELLLASARVIPQRLQQTDYDFRYPELEMALRHVLGYRQEMPAGMSLDITEGTHQPKYETKEAASSF